MSLPSSNEMPRAYNPNEVEESLYQPWMEKGYFTPEVDHSKKPFVVIMPLPNVTGDLHLGHALTMSLQDILTRWHRMLGEAALWLPGKDHAGIATQVVVERQLASEGKSRQEMGREKFLERMWDWVGLYGGNIEEQLKRMGASCDWSRLVFTLDPGPSRAVRTAFVDLYDKGLIYRGERIINWCIRCSTALSDLEVEYEEEDGSLYYVKYLLEDGEGSITVATTRPETMFGDTGVAVHPEDPRYQPLLGRNVILPLANRPIPVVGDEAIDREFGTGVLKVTPGHDTVDFEIGQRHNLPIVMSVDDKGFLTEAAGQFEGQERFEGRQNTAEELERQGYLVKTEPLRHSIGHCQRCATVVEPFVSKQWFIRIEPLATPAMDAVKDGRVRIVPERFSRVYLNWMENIRDWCISRQLWWGHRIPVWYCDGCDGLTVSVEDATSCRHCGSQKITQDPDVLDTWFSSGLWTHSTLGWPDESEALDYFYPSQVMVTGYDILFFWVARMIMMGIENMDEPPFETVFLHGLVRDSQGRKMSKTTGNVLDPLELTETYGTDALRFALTTGAAPGNDLLIADDGGLFPFGTERATHSLMGRFGNLMLVNGEPEYALELDRGEVVRFFLTNVSNTRTFNLSFGEPGTHRIKVVGSDLSKFERETWVDSVALAPAERYIVEVRYETAGEHALENRVRPLEHTFGGYFSRVTRLGTVTVRDRDADPARAPGYAELRENAPVVEDVARFRSHFDREPDYELLLTMDVTGLDPAIMQRMRADRVFFPAVEWADTMPMMNSVATPEEVRWIVREPATGREDMDIAWRFQVGDVVTIRIENDAAALHAMQHPFHIHGQRFLVLRRNGAPVTNQVFKDTVLIAAGETVDLLLEITNPGKWMAHCHIAEHLETGMRFVFEVDP